VEEPRIWDIMKTNVMPATATAFRDDWDSQVKVKVGIRFQYSLLILMVPISYKYLKRTNHASYVRLYYQRVTLTARAIGLLSVILNKFAVIIKSKLQKTVDS
jgi:hypothetical protein